MLTYTNQINQISICNRRAVGSLKLSVVSFKKFTKYKNDVKIQKNKEITGMHTLKCKQ